MHNHPLTLRLQCGKTEYKSITVAYDATASEFIDVYFDDDFRPNWVRCDQEIGSAEDQSLWFIVQL